MIRRRLLSAALALPLAGCTAWSTRPVPEPGRHEFLAGTARVTLADGSVRLLDHATVRADSVIGRAHEPPRERVALATPQVRRVEARRGSTPRTVALAAVVAAALAAAAVWAVHQAVHTDY